MEPVGTPEPPTEFRNVRLDGLRRAIDLYLAIAYPSGAIPEAVRRRLDWDESRPANELLAGSPFEKVGKGQAGAQIVALRLGNDRYPHMKVQIQPWGSSQGFLLSVNTHDQVLSVAADSPDMPAFRRLQAENQRIKESIEQAWDAAGLPTFLRYLRDYIAAHPAPVDP